MLSKEVPLDRAEAALQEMEAWLAGGDLPGEPEARAFLENLTIETLMNLAGGAGSPSGSDLVPPASAGGGRGGGWRLARPARRPRTDRGVELAGDANELDRPEPALRRQIAQVSTLHFMYRRWRGLAGAAGSGRRQCGSERHTGQGSAMKFKR